MIAGTIARLFRLPRPSDDVRVDLIVEVDRGFGGVPQETWTRTFGKATFYSRLRQGMGDWYGLVIEQFGPVTVGLGLIDCDGKLHVVVRRWTIMGIPLPLRFAPHGETFETELDGRFMFDVEIAQPLAGRIVRYTGWLERIGSAVPEGDPAASA